MHPAQPLEPYSRSEAMGRWLLTELERASLARHARRAAPAAAASLAAALAALAAERPPRYGTFVLCVPLAERSCYLVVTTKVCWRGQGRAGRNRAGQLFLGRVG